MARLLQIKISCNGMWCIQETDFSEGEMAVLHRIMGNQYMESNDYKLKGPCSPFFQGGHGNTKGWAFIEFWNPNKQDCQAFVDYVNTQINA